MVTRHHGDLAERWAAGEYFEIRDDWGPDAAPEGSRTLMLTGERGRTKSACARTAVLTRDHDRNPGPTNTGRYQYTGQTWLADVGLYHYKNRAYNPRLMRFMQTDPIGHSGGINLYAYVGGDPVNFTDPWGLKSTTTCNRFGCTVTRTVPTMVCSGNRCTVSQRQFSRFYPDDTGGFDGFGGLSNIGGGGGGDQQPKADEGEDCPDVPLAPEPDSGRLTIGQITDYHHRDFQAFGISRSAFGGTPLFGYGAEFTSDVAGWHQEC